MNEEQRPVSKYAAKAAKRYRYSHGSCEHRNTYIDRYTVPDGGFRHIHYMVWRCKDCDLILGEPQVEWKKDRDDAQGRR